jgi:hypothetical protein
MRELIITLKYIILILISNVLTSYFVFYSVNIYYERDDEQSSINNCLYRRNHFKKAHITAVQSTVNIPVIAIRTDSVSHNIW